MREIVDVVICEYCDAVHRKSLLKKNEMAYCLQCGAELERYFKHQYQYLLPLTIAGIILFIMANCFPIVELQMQGIHTQTTLIGSVISLFADRNPFVAFLVFATTFLFPFLQLVLLLLLLVSVNKPFSQPKKTLSLLVRVIRAMQPWSMLEVFMLGVIVAIIKLASLASIIIGVALWAFLALALLLGFLVSFDPRYFWQLTLNKHLNQ